MHAEVYFSPQSVSILRLCLRFATFRNISPLCGHRTLLVQSSTLSVSQAATRSIPCGRKVPEVIATTHMNMVTTLRNISHAKNLTAGDGWCHLAISRVCLHSEKGVGLNPYAPSQSLAHEARVTNKQRATMAVAFSSYQTEEATRTRRQGILHTTSPASATGENAFISMISARANSAAAVLN